MRYFYLVFLALLCLSFLPTEVYAQEPITLQDESGEYLLGLHLGVLEDAAGQLTIDEVSSEAYQAKFVPSTANVPNYGNTPSVYWARFEVVNQTTATELWYLVLSQQPNMHYVDLFVPMEDGAGFTKKQTGSLLSFDTRDVDYHFITFKLPLRVASKQTVYLRFQSQTAMLLGLKLQTPDVFIKASLLDQFQLAFMFGLIFIMAGYNLFLFFSLRDRSYFYYVLFLVGIGGYDAWRQGLIQQYLWRDSGQATFFISPLLNQIIMLGVLKFTDNFLQLDKQAPWWHRLINLSLGMLLILLVISWANFRLGLLLTNPSFLIMFIIAIMAGVVVWRNGYRAARFFLLAWAAFIASMILYLLTFTNVLQFSLMTYYSTYTGVILLVLLLSLALADRINQIKQEKLEIQAQNLDLQAAMNLTLKAANEQLEQKVAARTEELHRHNGFLAVQNEVAKTVSESLELKVMLQNTLQQILSSFGLTESGGLIFLLNEAKQHLELEAHLNLSAEYLAVAQQLNIGEGVTGLAMLQQQPIVRKVNDYNTPRFIPISEQEGIVMLVGVPLVAKGRAIGGLTLEVRQERDFAADELALLAAVGQQVGVAVDNARLYQLIQQANQELTRLNGDKDRFFSIVAHDLKGPFMPLLGNAELLTEMGDMLPPVEVKQIGASIQRTAKNVFSLLENLLAWARLQMGHMDYQPQRLDLAEIAAKTVELLSGNAAIKQIDLRSEVQPKTWVYADENMLDTVIRNLTNNALKFTPQGGQVVIGSKELGIRNYELGIKNEVTPNSQFLNPNYIEVAITDTGVGIPDHVKEKLFKIDEQITTVGTGKEKGTGLGLIICQEMVVKSGGHIWVESEVGKGTTVRFTVRLDGVS